MAAEAPPERLRRAETVLSRRCGRILVVLECVLDAHNTQACLRTAEALGIQKVWTVAPAPGQQRKGDGVEGERAPKRRKMARKITRGCERWMDLRELPTSAAAVAALRAEGYTIWASDLRPGAVCLEEGVGREQLTPLPPKLAVVIGNEALGVSEEMLAAADERVYLPMAGFTESFNLSVATALLLQRLFDWCPEARGDLDDAEQRRIRQVWYENLATNPTNEEAIAAWKERAQRGEVDSLPDLRRAVGGNMVPKKIRRRMREAQEAAVAAATPANGDATPAQQNGESRTEILEEAGERAEAEGRPAGPEDTADAAATARAS